MAKFRLRQTEIDAVQFVDGRVGEAIDFCPLLDVSFKFGARSILRQGEQAVPVRSLDAAMLNSEPVSNSDWIVRHEDGSFEVKDDTTFKAAYEAA